MIPCDFGLLVFTSLKHLSLQFSSLQVVDSNLLHCDLIAVYFIAIYFIEACFIATFSLQAIDGHLLPGNYTLLQSISLQISSLRGFFSSQPFHCKLTMATYFIATMPRCNFISLRSTSLRLLLLQSFIASYRRQLTSLQLCFVGILLHCDLLH